jgi:hypothetical protein
VTSPSLKSRSPILGAFAAGAVKDACPSGEASCVLLAVRMAWI